MEPFIGKKGNSRKADLHKNLFTAVLLVLLIITTNYASFPGQATAQGNLKHRSFIPLIQKEEQKPLTKVVGVTARGYWGTTTDDIQTMLKGLDNWSGQEHTIVGWFFDIVQEGSSASGTNFNFLGQLENLWVNGYVSFVNLPAGGATAAEIANHKYDSHIRNIANAYAAFVKRGGGRKAFLAPLQEMNGYWPTYGKDPVNFKLAYDNIRSIFTQAGVKLDQAWWTFAPNGWGEPGHEFEKYYPGNSKVDIVVFSSYNFGFCPVGNPEWRKWVDYTVVLKPFIERMELMAPTKPIIVAQTGTSAQYPTNGSYSSPMKNTWLVDSYRYLAQEPAVLGVLYFDINKEGQGDCDYEVYNGPRRYDGYKTAVGQPAFEYYTPAEFSSLEFNR